MKKIYFNLMMTSLLLSSFAINAQILFHENMETVDSVASSGTLGFNQTSALAYQSTYSVLGTYGANDSAFLTTRSFSTTGVTNVYFQFDHIAKIEFFDEGHLEYSSDSITWVQLVHNTNCTYMGTSPFYLQLPNGFSDQAYANWYPTVVITPDNTWWQHEVFNISPLASNHANNYLRFKLKDKNTTGIAGRYGWLIDNIIVSSIVNDGIKEMSSEQKAITIYPQPASEKVNLSFNKPVAGIQHLNLYDVNGKKIVFDNLQNIKPGTLSSTFDVSNLNNGIYFLRSDDGSNSSSVIVAH